LGTSSTSPNEACVPDFTWPAYTVTGVRVEESIFSGNSQTMNIDQYGDEYFNKVFWSGTGRHCNDWTSSANGGDNLDKAETGRINGDGTISMRTYNTWCGQELPILCLRSIRQPNIPEYSVVREFGGCLEGIELISEGSISNDACALATHNNEDCTHYFFNNGAYCACVQQGYECVEDFNDDGYAWMRLLEEEMFCWPNNPSFNVLLAADRQSLIFGGAYAHFCNDGCVVTDHGSGEYGLTKHDGSSNSFGGGAFTIAGSTLTWATTLVFTKDACPQEATYEYLGNGQCANADGIRPKHCYSRDVAVDTVEKCKALCTAISKCDAIQFRTEWKECTLNFPDDDASQMYYAPGFSCSGDMNSGCTSTVDGASGHGTHCYLKVASCSMDGDEATDEPTTMECPAPYKRINGNRCVWSCSTGTIPGEGDECVCQTGLTETSTDQFNRRVCTRPDIEGCVTYSADGTTCDECAEGYTRGQWSMTGLCRKCTCASTDADGNEECRCATCSAQGYCRSCIEGYDFDGSPPPHLERCTPAADAIKKAVVKRLFKIVPRMVERTKGNIRRVVERMKKDMERRNESFHQDEIDIITDIYQNVDIDEAIPFGRTMENIDRLNAFYRENGTPRDNTHASLDAGQVKVLLRVASTKHQVGYKEDLNRQMNKIIDIRDDEGLDYGLTYGEEELESLTANRNIPASQWLPFAYIQYFELREKYRDDGTMRN